MENNISIEDDSNDKKYFTLVPNYILNHSSATDQALYLQMKKVAGEKGTCWVSKKTLKQKLHIGHKALETSLTYLLEKKWIRLLGKKQILTKGGVQEVDEYLIVDIWKLNVNEYEGCSKIDPLNDTGCSESSARVFQKEAKGGFFQNTNKNHILNKNHIKEDMYTPFIKPTIDEVKGYCSERRNSVDPEKFCDFYESKGWLVGKTKMRDWRASVRTWEKGETKKIAVYQNRGEDNMVEKIKRKNNLI